MQLHTEIKISPMTLFDRWKEGLLKVELDVMDINVIRPIILSIPIKPFLCITDNPEKWIFQHDCDAINGIIGFINNQFSCLCLSGFYDSISHLFYKELPRDVKRRFSEYTLTLVCLDEEYKEIAADYYELINY